MQRIVRFFHFTRFLPRPSMKDAAGDRKYFSCLFSHQCYYSRRRRRALSSRRMANFVSRSSNAEYLGHGDEARRNKNAQSNKALFQILFVLFHEGLKNNRGRIVRRLETFCGIMKCKIVSRNNIEKCTVASRETFSRT